MLVLKAQLLALCEHDVSFLKAAGEADRQLLSLYGAQLCHAAAKLVGPRAPRGASVGARELGAVREAVARLDAKEM